MSKPETITIDEFPFVIKTLNKMGYKTTRPRSKTSNGADLFAIKKDYVLSVEVKKACYASKNHNVLRVRKVEKNRLFDDLIAIVLPNNYVLIEPMRDHLKCCSKDGTRYLNY